MNRPTTIFNMCDLCKNNSSDFIQKCLHKLCSHCLLISWLHLLFEKGIDADFFSEKAKMICPLCQQLDHACKPTFEKIGLQEFLIKKTREFDCVCLQERAIFHCLTCNIKIGEKCQSSPFHKNMKSHALLNINQNFMTLLCSCENFQPCYKYCNICSEAVCKACKKEKHQHKEKNLEIIDYKFLARISSKCETVAHKLEKLKAIFMDNFKEKFNSIQKISDISKKNEIKKKYGILIKIFDAGIEFENLPLQIRIYLSKINLFSREILYKPLNITENNNMADLQIGFGFDSKILSNFENMECKIRINASIKFKFNQKGVFLHFQTQDLEHCFLVPTTNQNHGNCLELYKITNGGIQMVKQFPSHKEINRQIDRFENYIYTTAESIHFYPLDFFQFGQQNRSEIYPQEGKGNCIRNMKMFRDTFSILPESKIDDLYYICSFDNISCVFLYHYKTQNKIYEFFNDQKLCTSLAVFNDKNAQKTYFVLGYQLSDIEIWVLGGAQTFELVGKIPSSNFCVNSIIIDSIDDTGFHLYFGYGNGKQVIGKVGKYEFNPSKQENITELGEVKFQDNQVFSMEIIEDKLLVGTYEYMILFDKHNLELSSARKCKTIEKDKIADITYFKNSDLGNCFAIISFNDQSLKIYEV